MTWNPLVGKTRAGSDAAAMGCECSDDTMTTGTVDVVVVVGMVSRGKIRELEDGPVRPKLVRGGRGRRRETAPKSRRANMRRLVVT